MLRPAGRRRWATTTNCNKSARGASQSAAMIPNARSKQGYLGNGPEGAAGELEGGVHRCCVKHHKKSFTGIWP